MIVHEYLRCTCNWRHDKIRVLKCLLWNITWANLIMPSNKWLSLTAFILNRYFWLLAILLHGIGDLWWKKVLSGYYNPPVLHINKKNSTKVCLCWNQIQTRGHSPAAADQQPRENCAAWWKAKCLFRAGENEVFSRNEQKTFYQAGSTESVTD